MKKFTQKDFIQRLFESQMNQKEFNEWMNNPENWNKDKTLNNTQEHESHWDSIRNLFNNTHAQINTFTKDEIERMDTQFLSEYIRLKEYWERLEKAPMSPNTFSAIRNSDTSSEFCEYKKNGEGINTNDKTTEQDKIRECINKIHDSKIEGNMEQKFKDWLKKQKTHKGNDFPEDQITNLCKDLRETIPSWDEVKFSNLFAINDIEVINNLYQRCLKDGDLKDLCKSVGNNRPSNALTRYKDFLQYIDRKYWVISPNVNGSDKTKKYKKIMAERQCVLMGWSTSNDLGARFNEKMQIGDLVLIAGRSNKNKEVFACGLVSSLSKDEGDYQVRYLQNFTELPKDNNLSFIDCTCGKSSQIKAIYQLHPNKNECDKKVVDYLLNLIKGKDMGKKLQEKINLLENKKQIILQGSPGTGKTREAKKIAEEMAPNNYKLIQFHPAYSYEDFVRGIVATTTDDGKVSYKVQNKVLAEMAENANKEYKLAKDEGRKPKKFVLIIDEINRANLSTVLGELIYALEYRGEVVESMYELDGSREIVLPENLYIIGTMNTADRSVGHIDYAIRRRFAFVDVNTDEAAIKEYDTNNLDLFKKVEALFEGDENCLSEEFELNDVKIGHSYFLTKDIDLAWEYEIKPILQEYRKDGVLICEKDKINDLKAI